MKIFILGATGNSGQQIVKQGLSLGHSITAFVRDTNKLETQTKTLSGVENLSVVNGAINDIETLAAAMASHDVVVNAAGNISDGPSYVPMIKNIVTAASLALPAGGRFWLFGGAAVLDVPNTQTMTLDLPRVPRLFAAHRENLKEVRATNLDWSMLCPGPMIPATTGKPRGDLRLSAEHWPVDPPAITRFLPPISLSIAFKTKIPEMTISYEDAASVILDHLPSDGRFSRQRVGVALPAGVRAHKDDIPVK